MAIRCLLISENDVMVAGVKAALTLNVDLEFFAAIAPDERELRRVIEDLRPDAVILDESADASQAARLLQLLLRRPALRIIVLNRTDNSLQVYQGQQLEVFQASDLGHIVRNEPPADNNHTRLPDGPHTP